MLKQPKGILLVLIVIPSALNSLNISMSEFELISSVELSHRHDRFIKSQELHSINVGVKA